MSHLNGNRRRFRRRLRQALKFSARLRDGHLQFIIRPLPPPPSYLFLDHLMQWAAKTTGE
jgi:hypothetical protein